MQKVTPLHHTVMAIPKNQETLGLKRVKEKEWINILL